MDRRNMLLIVLLEMWHLETLSACTLVALYILKLRRRRAEGTRKRKINESNDDSDRVVLALKKLFEASGKRIEMVTEAILKGNEDHSDIAVELKRMGLLVTDQYSALKVILETPVNILMFKSLDDELREVFVHNLLMENARGTGCIIMKSLYFERRQNLDKPQLVQFLNHHK